MTKNPVEAEGAARLRALEAHETQLSAVVHAVKLAVISVDESQTIVLFNPEAEAIFRCSATEAIGGPLDRFIPAAVRRAHRHHVASYDGSSGDHGARTMGGDRILTGMRADGEEFPIEASISIAAVEGRKLYTVILRDVSERVKFQEELKRYADIVDSSGDAIISRSLEGRITTWNPAAGRLFGYSMDEMMGEPISRLYSPQTPVDQKELTLRAVNGESIVNFETVRRHKDGSDISVAITLSLVRDMAGRVTGSSAIYRDMSERKRMESELRRLIQEQRRAETELRESRDRLRELSSALQSIREEEKTRIARELHDELGQALTALKMDAAAIESELEREQNALRKRTSDMKQLIDTTVASVRRISADLRPVMLDNLGLVPTLEWLASDFSQRSGVKVELDIPEENLGVSGDAATAIFRIAQEAMTNVSRHAGADRVVIELKRRGGNVVVRIRDNGKGFTRSDTRKARSFGLLGMRERAYVLGGELKISTPQGGGTQIEAVIPIFGVSHGGDS